MLHVAIAHELTWNKENTNQLQAESHYPTNKHVCETRSTQGTDEKHKILVRKPKGKHHLLDLGVDVMVILV